MSRRPVDLNVASWMKAIVGIVAWFMCGAGSLSAIAAVANAETMVSAPTVTAVIPSNLSTGVPINIAVIAATFSEALAPIAGGDAGSSTFTLTCAPPCANVAGSVSLDATKRTASLSFLLKGGATLAPLTVYSASIVGVRSLESGVVLVTPYVWQFTTGMASDKTMPTVMFTTPPTVLAGPKAAMSSIPVNASINAVFSKDIAPAAISAATFKLNCAAPCVSPAGRVSYAIGSRTATFTPASVLTPGAIYTATITAAATDLAGNGLAGNRSSVPAAGHYMWTFAATAPSAAANVVVLSTNPASAAVDVCPGASINATFAAPSGFAIDAQTVNAENFVVTGPLPATKPVPAASVVVDAATGRIATFTPATAFALGATYTATIKRGVKDLALPANVLAGDVSWKFTAGRANGGCLAPVALGSARNFASFGGTEKASNAGLLTVLHGDIGTTAAATAVSGFHEGAAGCTYNETSLNRGAVNGKIYTAASPSTFVCPGKDAAATLAIAGRGRADALAAYKALAAITPGPDPGNGNLANRVLTPGVYTAAGGSFRIQGGNLTLDAKGNANAVWIFQMADTLTVGGPGAVYPQSVVLVNGAQHKNVFWQVGGNATINAAGGGTMVGTIISQGGAAFSTAGNATRLTLNGRVMSLGATVTMANTVINVPAP